jgi:hypothetical protein
VAAVEHAGTEASRLTAEVYARELEISPSASDVPLTPDAECFPPYAPQTAREQIAPTRRHIEERLELERPAILLVGHEPAIGWLLDGWIDQPISLVAGEVVCLAREASTRDEWHVWWMLTPSKAAAIDQLREKIESKMTLLSVLAGFTLAVTGQVLIDLPKETGPRLLASGAAVCFVVAAATYFCTLLAYDQLMMPPRFWRGGAPAATPRGPLGPGVVARPPSSAGIVLFQQMTAVWKWVIGALVITGAGVVLLGLSKAWTNGAAASLAVVGAAGVIAAGIAVCWSKVRPRLGTED